jgi:hypothetical protein
MTNILDVFRDNLNTYYVIHEDGSKSFHSLRNRYALIFLTSLAISLIPTTINEGMVTGVITAQSILMGFAFNVMVYISSQDALKVDSAGFREDKAKFSRLNELADEIFYNLSYYIALALLSVILCVWWFVVSAGNSAYVFVSSVALHIDQPWIEVLPSVGSWLVRFGLLVTTFESILTFSRLIRRVTFHFKERRKAQRKV